MGSSTSNTRDPTATPGELVVCSLEAWDDVWRRNQFLVRELTRAEPGLRVLFVEPPSPSQHAVLRSVQESVWAIQPHKYLPASTGRLGQALIDRQVEAAVRQVGFGAPVLWVNDSRYARLAMTRPWPVLYDITDDWLLEDTTRREIWRRKWNEQKMMKVAQVVVVCSPGLQASRGKQRPVTLIPNAVDVGHMRRPQPRPVDMGTGVTALYVGSLHEQRVDVALIEELAVAEPHLSIILVGPIALRPASVARLAAHPNVRLLGPRPYAVIPAYLQHANVLIVAHALNRFTASLDPIKAYECIAVGTPTVATPVAGFRGMGKPIVCAEPGDFVAAVVAVLSKPMGVHHLTLELPSWQMRAAEFAAALDKARETTRR